MNFHHFPPFWHCVRIVSKCDKLVTITLFGIYLVNKTIKYDKQKWICLRTVDSTELMPKNRFYKAKMKWNVWVYSIGLWICLPWDFCASSWDCEIVLKTVRLETSGRAVNWLQSCSAQDVEWKRNAEVSNMPNFIIKHSLLLRPEFVKSIRNLTKT